MRTRSAVRTAAIKVVKFAVILYGVCVLMSLAYLALTSLY